MKWNNNSDLTCSFGLGL